MYKYLTIFLLLFSLSFSIEHGKLELNVTKQTNGSYIWAIPHYESEEYNGYLVNEKELELRFFSSRENKTALNHYSVYLSQGLGLEANNFYAIFSINLEYFFEDNNSDDSMEHAEFSNTLKFGYEF